MHGLVVAFSAFAFFLDRRDAAAEFRQPFARHLHDGRQADVALLVDRADRHVALGAGRAGCRSAPCPPRAGAGAPHSGVALAKFCGVIGLREVTIW